MKRIELLAPVGNFDCLKAAIEAGCNAVYLGGKMFGARSFAGNFTKEELVEAIKYSHLYGVKVYLTINTIIYENEVDNFLEYVRFAHKNNIDAVIIQDLGMFDLLRKKFPNLELHASTQVNIHNYEGALLAKKLGFKRVVMARETPVSIIEKIKKEIDIEVEVFVHGALCVSYSGQCLMSSLIGHRSGNRGTCVQSCRKKYDLYDEKGNKLNKEDYLLSTKDLCTLENLDKIIKTGVDSLKIEGRMKRPEYVYLVSKVYKKAIDNYYATGRLKIDEKDMLNLKKMFNRKFTKGFILGEKNDAFTFSKRPNHKGITIGEIISKVKNNLKIKLTKDVNVHDGLRILDTKEDKGLIINKMFVDGKEVSCAKKGDVITVKYDKYVEVGSKVLLTTDYNLVSEINKCLNKLSRKVGIDIKVVAKKDYPLQITVSDGVNEVIEMSHNKIEQAIKMPVLKETIIKQMCKTGDTVYKVNNIEVVMDEDIFINLKDINDLRRNILKKLDKKRLYKIPFVENEYYIDVPSFENCKHRSVEVTNKSDYDKIKNKVDKIYVTNEKLLEKEDVLKLPRIINEYKKYENTVLVGEFGSLLVYKNFMTDFSFNVVNSYAVAFFHEMGSKCVTLSYELTVKQIENIVSAYEKRYKKLPNLEVIIDSFPEAMVSKFDLNKRYNIKIGYLKDEFNNKYKIVSNKDFMTIYNFEKIIINEEELSDKKINSTRTIL